MSRALSPSWPLARPQAFVIDLDGTLVDTLGDFVAVLDLVMDELGLPRVSADFVARTIGRGSENLIRRSLAEVGADAGLYEQAWQRYQQHYARLNGRHARLFPGVREALQALRALGLPMACLTNKPAVPARQLLTIMELDRFFDRVFGGDDFERKKPDPLPLLKTCEALDVAPQATWMIGDSSNDAAAARAAGCAVLLLRHGYNHGEPLEQAGADVLLERFAQLPPLVARALHPV